MTATAATIAAELSEAQRAAVRAERTAYDRREAARREMYEAEHAQEQAKGDAAARSADLLCLLRALANRSETEPREIPNRDRYSGQDAHFAATFGTARVYVHSSQRGYSSKPQPQVVEAIVWPADKGGPSPADARTVYDSGRGTRDEAKITEHREAARKAAVAALQPLTAAAYLRARGIDPATAPEPAELLAVHPSVTRKADYWQGQRVEFWSVSWYVTLRGSEEPIPGLELRDGWDIAEARADAAAGGRYKATHEAKNAAREDLEAPGADTPLPEVEDWAADLADEALSLIVARHFGPRGDE